MRAGVMMKRCPFSAAFSAACPYPCQPRIMARPAKSYCSSAHPSLSPRALCYVHIAHPIHEITLQILFIGNLLLFHPCLTQRAFLPISFTGFITTDMDISGREQFQNLIHHILKKGIDTVISGTIDDLGISSSQTGSTPIYSFTTGQAK